MLSSFSRSCFQTSASASLTSEGADRVTVGDGPQFTESTPVGQTSGEISEGNTADQQVRNKSPRTNGGWSYQEAVASILELELK